MNRDIEFVGKALHYCMLAERQKDNFQLADAIDSAKLAIKYNKLINIPELKPRIDECIHDLEKLIIECSYKSKGGITGKNKEMDSIVIGIEEELKRGTMSLDEALARISAVIECAQADYEEAKLAK